MGALKNKNNEVDYSRTILIVADIKLVYNAIVSEIDKWWGTVEGESSNLGNVFKIKFGGDSYWKFEIIELVKNQQIMWKCIESNQDHNLKGIDEEWLNSKVSWYLSKSNSGTILKFLHEGLIPSSKCYDVCSEGWDFYLVKSLKSYLETGKGFPNGK